MNIIYSFIIPHHNSPFLLNRCLDSIPQRKDVEIIVVDDNSDKDKKPQVARLDVNIIYIDAKRTKGAGRARNYALTVAKGRWFIFADADDFFVQGFLDVLDKFKEKQVDVVYYNAKMVSSETLLPYNNYIDSSISIISRYDGTLERENEVRYRLKAPWWKMVRKDLIINNRIKFEEVPKGNDIFFSLQVGFNAKKILVLDVPLYVYTYNKKSISNRKKNENIYFNDFCVRNRLLGFYEFLGHPEWITSQWILWLRIIKHDGFSIFFKTIKKCIKEHTYLSKCRSEYVKKILSR